MSLRPFKSKLASFSVLTALIGTVLVGIGLLAIGYKITVGSGQLNNEQACRLSIFAADQASAIRSGALDTIDIVPNLECEPEDVVIESKDVRRSRRGHIDDDLVKRKIATEMADCWSMVGEGKLNPFQAFWPGFSKTYCMTCATIEFSPDFVADAERQDYELTGLNYWVSTRRMPGKEKSFYEYMFNRIPSDQEIQRLHQHPDSWDLNKKYFLIWRFEKLASTRFMNSVTVAALVGTISLNPISAFMAYTVVSLVGDDLVSQGVFLLPQEELSGKIQLGETAPKDVCTIMVN